VAAQQAKINRPAMRKAISRFMASPCDYEPASILIAGVTANNRVGMELLRALDGKDLTRRL
jgi:hypothetical protein